MIERKPTRTATTETSVTPPGFLRRVVPWFFLSGVFLVLHLVFLRQRELELQSIPIHLALLGLLSALLLGALQVKEQARGRFLWILGIMLLSFLVTMSLTLPGLGAGTLWIAWPVLLLAATGALFRGKGSSMLLTEACREGERAR